MSLWVGYPRSYTPGRRRSPQFVTLHYTAGSEGPMSAENGAAYDKIRTDGTSTHYFTDSAGPALQEVPEGDRSHSAFFHGNEIGIHIEICGTRQTRDQWLDATSYATLVTTAALVREVCVRQGFPMRRLSVAETRAAYYNAAGSRPAGINDHAAITLAYPEDGGTHDDVGVAFPWDVFMGLVWGGTPQEDDMAGFVIYIVIGGGPYAFRDGRQVWKANGMYRIPVSDDQLRHQGWVDSGRDPDAAGSGLPAIPTNVTGLIGPGVNAEPWVTVYVVPADKPDLYGRDLRELLGGGGGGPSGPVDLTDAALDAVEARVDKQLDELAD